MSELFQVLDAFHNPSTSSTVAERLGRSERLIDGLLLQLESRGLVVPAEPGLGACSSGCGFCSMQSFCPKSEADGQDPAPVSIKPRVWRLTALGQRTVEQRTNLASPTSNAG